MALSSRDARMWEPDDELMVEALSRPEKGDSRSQHQRLIAV